MTLLLCSGPYCCPPSSPLLLGRSDRWAQTQAGQARFIFISDQRMASAWHHIHSPGQMRSTLHCRSEASLQICVVCIGDSCRALGMPVDRYAGRTGLE
jgi:hypothetical protein